MLVFQALCRLLCIACGGFGVQGFKVWGLVFRQNLVCSRQRISSIVLGGSGHDCFQGLGSSGAKARYTPIL